MTPTKVSQRRTRIDSYADAGRYQRLVVVIALSLLTGACGGRGSNDGNQQERRGTAARDWSGVVTRVSDGDTLWVTPASGAPRKVRIDGIDAPESCQSGGAVAGTALRKKLLRQRVQVTTRALDDYRRELATVRLDGQDVGAWLVERGYAWSYRYRRNPGPYLREEQQARRGARGLFADPNAINPREFRKSHGPC